MVAVPFFLLVSLSLKKAPTSDYEGGLRSSMLREAVVADRQRKKLGVLAGSSMLVAAGGVGLVAGIFEAPQVMTPIAAVAVGVAAWATSLEEDGEPLPESYFYVEESRIPGAGQGLFASRPIEMGTFMLSYEGERLTEEDYFERYPDGQGFYIAELPSAPWSLEEPIYVDGIDSTKSGLARWMNSKSGSESNVRGQKSILGERNLYFYAERDIEAGEELCFDYGSNYWDAVANE